MTLITLIKNMLQYSSQAWEITFFISIFIIFLLICTNLFSLYKIRKMRSSLLTLPKSTNNQSNTPDMPNGEELSTQRNIISEPDTYPPLDIAKQEEKAGGLVENVPLLKLTKNCVHLFEELEQNRDHFDLPRQEVADYVCTRLTEILEFSGVEVVTSDTTFDSNRHRPEHPVTRIAPGTAIASTISPGFAIGPYVLRRARVRLSEQISE